MPVFSSFWGLERAAVCDCGTPWTFLLPFLFCLVPSQIDFYTCWSPSRFDLKTPVIFVYINDIVFDICSNIRLFADDTSAYIVVDDSVTAAACINADLGRITQWAAK